MLIPQEKIDTFFNNYDPSTEDIDYTHYVQIATNIAEDYCNRVFLNKVYKDNFRRLNIVQREIIVDAYPITKITYIKVRDTLLSDSDYDYDPMTGIIFLLKSYGRYADVEVEYEAGYTVETVPESLVFAILSIAKNLIDSKGKSLNLQSEKIGDYSYTRKSGSEKDKIFVITELLDPYKKLELF